MNEDVQNSWVNWRNHCEKIAVEEGYLEKEERTTSELELTSFEDGGAESEFLHGYDEMP